MFIVDAASRHFGPPPTVDARTQRLPDRPVTPRWLWITFLGVMTVVFVSYLDTQSQSGGDGNPIYAFLFGAAALIPLGGLYWSERRGVWADKDGISWRGAFMSEHAQWSEVADLQLEEETTYTTYGEYRQQATAKFYPVTIRVMMGPARGTHKLPLTHRSTTEAKRNVDAMRRMSKFKLDLQDDVVNDRFGRLFD